MANDLGPDAGRADPSTFRFEYVCEAIGPDGSRHRIGSFAIPAQCLLCGRLAADATAGMDGTTLATVNNRCGLVCAPCTVRERARL